MNNQVVSFYSNYAYLRPISRGKVSSVDNGFGAQEVNATIPIPSSVTQRPAYIEYYVEYPIGEFKAVGGNGTQLFAGHDDNIIYINGYDPAFPFDAQFTVHYLIYDRRVA